MSTYIESKPYLHEIGKRAYTSSTLKIPRELLDYLYMREAAFGSRRDYFSHLIRTYGRYLGRFGFDKFAFKWKNKAESPILFGRFCTATNPRGKTSSALIGTPL